MESLTFVKLNKKLASRTSVPNPYIQGTLPSGGFSLSLPLILDLLPSRRFLSPSHSPQGRTFLRVPHHTMLHDAKRRQVSPTRTPLHASPHQPHRTVTLKWRRHFICEELSVFFSLPTLQQNEKIQSWNKTNLQDTVGGGGLLFFF